MWRHTISAARTEVDAVAMLDQDPGGDRGDGEAQVGGPEQPAEGADPLLGGQVRHGGRADRAEQLAISPTPRAAAQIAGMVSAAPSATSATAVPRNPTSMVWRRPIRSPSQPPNSCDPMSPTPNAATTAPAVAGVSPRSWVRYSTRNAHRPGSRSGLP
jgi:hypothetical protein